MTLRIKTLIIVALTFLVLVSLLYAMAQTVLMGDFANIEDQAVIQNADRVLSAVADDVNALNMLTSDWSDWDDTYRFLQDGNPDYLAANMTDATFSDLHLDYVAIVDNDGRIVYDEAFDLAANRRVSPAPALRTRVSGNSRLLKHSDVTSNYAGLLSLPEGLFYVAARPIVNSHGQGPIRGTFIFIRTLNDDAVARLAQTTHLPLTIRPLDDPALPANFQAAREVLLQGAGPISSHESENGPVAGYALLKDIDDQPIGMLRIDMPRAIYQKGQHTIQTFTLLILLVGAICAVVLGIALEHYALTPLSRLTESVNLIGAGRSPSARVRLPGRDEFAALARQIDSMLEALGRSEQALRESEAKYRLLVERATDGIVITQNGSLKYVNPRAAQIVGLNVGELVDRPLQDLIWPEALPVVVAIQKERRANRASASAPSPAHGANTESHHAEPGTGGSRAPAAIFETSLRHRDGHRVDVEVNVGDTTFDDRPATLVFVRDISERRETAALAAEKERLAVTLRSIGEGVITTDVAGRIVLMNRAAQELTGWAQTEAEGHPLTDVFHLVDEKSHRPTDTPIHRVLRGKASEMSGYPLLVDRQGLEHTVTVRISPMHDRSNRVIGVVLVVSDITDKRRMEQELLRAQSIESIGFLAGGIAHDFNNILTGILGNLSLARLRIPAGGLTHDALTEAEQATLRARALTEQLLTFSKGGAPLKQATSIAQVLRESGQFAVRGSTVRTEFILPDDLRAVEADPGQISQVVHNLMLNACQAMPTGGVITVKAENFTLGPSHSGPLPLAPGRYVKIVIQDQGVGIPPEHLSHIFEPYFTTKEKGTGLGLATTYSIIRRHGGHITVESGPGRGATFIMYLPAAAEPAQLDLEPAGQSPARAPRRPAQGHGHVLIMDDERTVREMAGRLLQHLGYTADLARDGVEALKLYRTALDAHQPYDAVIMDLTVPGGMGGAEAVRQLLELDPNARAIVSSGYSTDPVLAHFRKYHFAGILVKPYRIEDIAKALQQVLNQ